MLGARGWVGSCARIDARTTVLVPYSSAVDSSVVVMGALISCRHRAET